MSKKLILSVVVVVSLLVSFFIFLLKGNAPALVSTRLAIVEKLPISETTKNTLITDNFPSEVVTNRLQQKTVVARESNSPRGIFVSYANSLLTLKEDTGKQNIVAGNDQKIQFSCVPDVNQTQDGTPFSLYDTYVNVSGFVLNRQTKLFLGEIDVQITQTQVYAGSKMIYVTKNLPGVVPGDLEMKVIFLGCKSS